jgi:sugar O-acyltransferase (sialic acid O-acetyltransferase NeuD family)
MISKHIIFWGGAGQAKVLNEALHNTEFKLVLLVDNRKALSPIHSIPIVCGESGLDQWLHDNPNTELYFSVAIGGSNGKDRLTIASHLLGKKIIEHTIIHKTAYIANDAVIGSGSQILASSTICTHVNIGRQVIINTAASVDHDCVIHDGVHIGPGASLAGEIVIEKNVFVGTGAIILPKLSIGANTIIGAGAVVTKSISANKIVAGNPSRSLY